MHFILRQLKIVPLTLEWSRRIYCTLHELKDYIIIFAVDLADHISLSYLSSARCYCCARVKRVPQLHAYSDVGTGLYSNIHWFGLLGEAWKCGMLSRPPNLSWLENLPNLYIEIFLDILKLKPKSPTWSKSREKLASSSCKHSIL